jgi:hypothetical protein
VTQRPHLSVAGKSRRAPRRYADIVLGTLLLIFATTFMVVLAVALMPVAKLGAKSRRRSLQNGQTTTGLESTSGGTDALSR